MLQGSNVEDGGFRQRATLDASWGALCILGTRIGVLLRVMQGCDLGSGSGSGSDSKRD